MEPSEIEFLAEQESVGIIPKFNDHRTIHLISGDVGPFRAGIQINVPIWVALNLRQKQKCSIVPPSWMDIDVLSEKLEEEKNSRFFTKMPSDHYMEVAHLLLGAASEDIQNAGRVRTAIKDLWDLRIAKARSSADSFLKGGGRHAGIDHLTQLEICTIRPLLTDALDTIYRISTGTADVNSQSVSSSRSQSFASRPSTSETPY